MRYKIWHEIGACDTVDVLVTHAVAYGSPVAACARGDGCLNAAAAAAGQAALTRPLVSAAPLNAAAGTIGTTGTTAKTTQNTVDIGSLRKQVIACLTELSPEISLSA